MSQVIYESQFLMLRDINMSYIIQKSVQQRLVIYFLFVITVSHDICFLDFILFSLDLFQCHFPLEQFNTKVYRGSHSIPTYPLPIPPLNPFNSAT